jgi:protein translocase SEC61 complex gamma subunit
MCLVELNLGRTLTATWRTLKLTRKSDREEFFLYMKLVLLGFGIVGTIGFIIYFIASEIELIAGVSGANASGATPAILAHLLSGVL